MSVQRKTMVVKIGSSILVDEAKGEVVVEIAGKNGWGNHVNGTVRVALPRSK